MKKLLKFLPLLCALAFAGCAHERVLVDVEHPEIELTCDRRLLFRNRPIKPKELPSELERAGVGHEETVHIKVQDLTDLRAANDLLVYLRMKGYTRAILVTKRHGISSVDESKSPYRRRLP